MLPPAGRAAPPLPTACLPKDDCVSWGWSRGGGVNMVLNLIVIIVFHLLFFWDERLRVVFHVCLGQWCLVVERPSFTLLAGIENEHLFSSTWGILTLCTCSSLEDLWDLLVPHPFSGVTSWRHLLSESLETFLLTVLHSSTDPRALAKYAAFRICLQVCLCLVTLANLPPPASRDSGLVFSVCELVGKH